MSDSSSPHKGPSQPSDHHYDRADDRLLRHHELTPPPELPCWPPQDPDFDYSQDIQIYEL